MFKQYRAAMSNNTVDDEYELQYSGTVNELIPVCKYKSHKTGLRVVVAQVDGPLVNGYFCLATEALDDDGLPHTLEHLVFLGSEEYPFKGVLDLLANRCLASGTNAWTDTDHTCYTITTAGSDGFLNLMPVYLDHILYPTLTESGYKTEVHHINNEGEDAGVVYSEMQARENTGESRTHLAMLRAIYPPGCGYRSETGGILHNLRTSTSHLKVKNYHAEFYRPENLYLIVTGMVEPKKVLQQIQIVEKKILAKGSLPEYTRPWQAPVPPLEQSVEIVERYPSDDEENGMVVIAWRGPLAMQQKQLAAVMILMEYLTDTAVAPLQREFVELTEPFCNEVRYSVIENSESCVYLHFENVPFDKLKDIKPRLLSVLNKLVTDSNGIDMSRMHTVVHRHVLEAINSLEAHPHDTIAFHVIGEFLYGNTTEDMELRLNNILTFRQLDTEPKEYWTQLINTYFLTKNYVTVIGEPSQKLMEDMGEEEKQRISRQAEQLGEDGLAAKQQELEQAVAVNECTPSDDLLTCFDVPDVNSIHFHSISPSNNYSSSNSTNKLFPLDGIPVCFQLDDIKTNFIMLTVLMDTSCIPYDLKPYLPLYLEVILECPVLRDGVVVPYEQVISELAADTLFNSASLGAVGGKRFSCGDFASQASLSLKVEVDRYLKGVAWLRDLLYGVEFAMERVHIIANKMLNDVARLKRDGQTVVQTLNRAIQYNKESNHFTASMLRQYKFLSQLVQKLETESNGVEVIECLDRVRTLLTQPSNLRVHMAAHVESLTRHYTDNVAVDVWTTNFIPPTVTSSTTDRPVVRRDSEFVIYDGDNGEYGNTGMIVGVGSVESAYLIQSTPCVSDFNDPDLAAILVFIQYLTQLEGPMWKQIRGQGLSYHYRMYVKPETGLLYFILFKSSQLVDAYKEANKILSDYVNGTTAFSDVELVACKSSLIFNVIEEEETPAQASVQSMLSYLRGIDLGYNRRIIQMIPNITVDDLRRVGPKYFAPLFDVARSKVAICCHPTKVEEICTEFRSVVNKELTVVESLDDSFLCDI